VSTSHLHRVFWAVCPPEACIQRTARLVEQLRGPVQKLGLTVAWVRPDSLHITLKFLGDCTSEQLSRMVEPLAQLVQGRPQLTAPLVVLGLAAFPSLERPRVLFATVTETVQATQLPLELAQLQAELDRALVGLGHRADDHRFHPHLTLGRVKDATPDRTGTRPKALLELAERVCPLPLSEPFVPPSLILFESQQTEHGTRYLPLHTLPLSPTETR